ncbi:MAG: UPF0158 family protein [Gemmatimonadota bacterium]|jgi:hypothetical protein|nr:hypothetical protein [Gemmatimonadota bacterium]MDP6528947.1 UPF0158 family protein [Gemmatimonadota bacterium]MDP6802569.1 UPF0158 family protein [Gemmatimonadota bacterium]MDP7032742.1 UPF0158 family protein [Gemmatimonadota bacterium]
MNPSTIASIDRAALSRALEDADSDREHYLCLTAGTLHTFVRSRASDESADAYERVQEGLGDEFLRIPSRNPQAAFEEIEDFVESVENPEIRDEFFRAIERRGALRNFREAILPHSQEMQRWSEWRREGREKRMEGFLRSLPGEALTGDGDLNGEEIGAT